MSIINQMLKDLDKRSKTRPSHQATLSGLYASHSYQRRNKKDTLVLAFISLFVICILVTIPFFKDKKIINNNPYLNPTKIINSNNIKMANPKDIELNLDVTPAILTGITLQTQADMTFLRFLLNNDVLYRINLDINKHELTVVLEHTRLLTTLPTINYANSSIQLITMKNEENGDLRIVIKLEENALIQHLNLSQTGKLPEFQMDIRHQSAWVDPQKKLTQETPPPIPPVKKFVVDMAVEEDYRNALAIATSGQTSKAVQLLKTLLNKNPSYNPARQTLITLLMQEGYQSNAEKIADMGLMQQPDYLPFVELKARILVNENKIDDSLKLLENISPSIAEHTDYYALIAALYQREGRAKMAEKLYEQLLAIQPNKSVWWVGLGIALNTTGKHTEAQEAFARAADNPGLTPELRAYVETELHET